MSVTLWKIKFFTSIFQVFWPKAIFQNICFTEHLFSRNIFSGCFLNIYWVSNIIGHMLYLNSCEQLWIDEKLTLYLAVLFCLWKPPHWFTMVKCWKKQLWRSVIFSEVAGQWPTTLLKMTLLHRCFFQHFAIVN